MLLTIGCITTKIVLSTHVITKPKQNAENAVWRGTWQLSQT